MNKKKCFLLLIILCMLSVSVPIVAAGSPDAKEVLRRFAKARENFTSFIVEYDTKTTFNYPQQNWNGEQYANVEYRFDGNRARECFSIWGNVSKNFHPDVPEDQPQYTILLWDGENRYSYTRTSQSDPGLVIMTRKKDPGGVPKEQTRIIKNNSLPGEIMGYHWGDNGKRIDEILDHAEHLQLRQHQEKLRGVDCYVIDAVVKRHGKYRLWIDPIHDYYIAKIHVRRKEGGYIHTKMANKNQSTNEMFEILRFQKVGDSWFPLEYKMKRTIIDNGRLSKENKIITITNIVLNPDHDALKSFIPDDIPNGATVKFTALPPSKKFLWQDGQVVDKDGREVMNSRPIKPAGSAESKPKSAVRKRPSAWELLRRYAEQQAKVSTPRSKERVVHFPKDRHLGILKLQDDTDFEYENFGSATGDVTVPAGKRLILFVGRDAWKDLSHLAELEPDDLYSVTLSGSYHGGAKPGDYYLRHFAGLTGLKVLRLSNTNITYKGLRHLKQLKSLNYLELSSGRLGDRALPHIAELTSLETLVFGSSVTDDGLRHLASLNNLKQLVLWVNDIRGPGLRHLAELPNLHDIFLNGTKYGGKCKFTDSSLRYLKDVKSLRKIRLARGLQITDAGIAHLSKLAGLEGLNLYGHPITNAGLAHLKSLNSLKELDLRKTKISSGALMQLRQMKSLEYLKLPSIVTDSVTDADMAYLGELDKLKCLHVGIGDGRITDAGLSHVAKLHRLEELSISGKDITDAGMSHIAKLTNLRFLNLWTDQVTNAGLAKLTTLKSLKKLCIYRANISTSGLAHLNELPNLTELIVRDIKQDSKPLNISGLGSLKSLRLRFERDLGPRDEDLACLGKLTRLKVLGISPHKGITDKGLQHLAGLTNIWMLSVGSDKVTDDGLAQLANMQKLSNLTLTGNFTDIGLRHLEKLEALAVLDFMSGANFTPRSLNQFRKKMPHLSLLRDYGKSQKQRPKSRR